MRKLADRDAVEHRGAAERDLRIIRDKAKQVVKDQRAEAFNALVARYDRKFRQAMARASKAGV